MDPAVVDFMVGSLPARANRRPARRPDDADRFQTELLLSVLSSSALAAGGRSFGKPTRLEREHVVPRSRGARDRFHGARHRSAANVGWLRPRTDARPPAPTTSCSLRIERALGRERRRRQEVARAAGSGFQSCGSRGEEWSLLGARSPTRRVSSVAGVAFALPARSARTSRTSAEGLDRDADVRSRFTRCRGLRGCFGGARRHRADSADSTPRASVSYVASLSKLQGTAERRTPSTVGRVRIHRCGRPWAPRRGCSSGYFLRRARRRGLARGHGLDPDPRSGRVARGPS